MLVSKSSKICPSSIDVATVSKTKEELQQGDNVAEERAEWRQEKRRNNVQR
jgi:hypothetical protein